MSNRTVKLKLWNENPHCHWCGKLTVLTNLAKIGNNPDPDMATVDHIVSRYSYYRWVRKSRNEEQRKVLACYDCNQKRSAQETLCLSREEILRRSKGFSLSPRGKGKIPSPLPNVRAVKKALKA
jgi:hypothetical protein